MSAARATSTVSIPRADACEAQGALSPGDVLPGEASGGRLRTGIDASPRTRADSHTSVLTPLDALLRDEAQRVRVLTGYAVALIGLVIAGLQVLDGDPVAHRVHCAGLGVTAAVGLFIRWRLRDIADYRPLYGILFGHAIVIGAASGFYYWGVFSASLVVVPAAGLVLAQGRSFWGLLSVGVAALAAHAVIGILIITGVLADRGLTSIGDHGAALQVFRLIQMQLIMGGSFVLARRVRRSALRAMEQLDVARRELGKREALLVEANAERRELLGVGVAGRYTHHQLGDYRLGLILGHGAHGVVYEATHAITGAEVAVKLLHPHLLARPDQFRRFAHELQAASSLRSPHVVRVFELPPGAGEFPFMVMERLRGESLADYLKVQVTLPIDDVVDMIRQVGQGLREVHRAGLVHRDLKPRNVFRVAPPLAGVTWKILDFGICKHLDAESTLTEGGHVIGTPAYMAPEQARGVLGASCDLYSLAAIAYRALIGQPPFSRRDIPSLVHDVVTRMPPRPSDLRPVHADVDRVFAIALAKQPSRRFADAPAFAEALASAGRGDLSADLRTRAERLVAAHPWQHRRERRQ